MLKVWMSLPTYLCALLESRVVLQVTFLIYKLWDTQENIFFTIRWHFHIRLCYINHSSVYCYMGFCRTPVLVCQLKETFAKYCQNKWRGETFHRSISRVGVTKGTYYKADKLVHKAVKFPVTAGSSQDTMSRTAGMYHLFLNRGIVL